MRAIDPLRQACTGCGGSCHGVRVRVLQDEVASIVSLAMRLGVPDAVEDGRMRMIDGHCALLDERGLCRLHAAGGSLAKPAVCRQYPLVVTDTGAERRVGLDPGCYTAWSTRGADPLDTSELLANPVRLDPAQERHEAGLAALLGAPGITVAGALAPLVGDVLTFAERWAAHLRAPPLAALLARSDTGDPAREALRPVLERVASGGPGPVVLPPELDAWAVDVTRRLVVLRLVPAFPFLPGLAVLSLGGALACAWTDPTPEVYARRLAAWTRVLRAPPWWGALAPSPEAMLALLGR
jgi:hypothetical protein